VAKKLTHLDKHGRAHMVYVGDKPVTKRSARAEATVLMQPATLAMISSKSARKGDVLAVARVAGIQAAKRTHHLIPLCHALAISSIEVNFDIPTRKSLHIESSVRCTAETGVEMEALVAAGIAALTVYDMLKAVDRGMEVTHLRVVEKSGGRSGKWTR